MTMPRILRRFSRAPMFTATVLLTLAIGIGANTAVFSVVNGVLLKPLPYPRAEELLAIWHSAPGIVGFKEGTVVSAVLLAAAMVASYLPARRAA